MGCCTSSALTNRISLPLRVNYQSQSIENKGGNVGIFSYDQSSKKQEVGLSANPSNSFLEGSKLEENGMVIHERINGKEGLIKNLSSSESEEKYSPVECIQSTKKDCQKISQGTQDGRSSIELRPINIRNLPKESQLQRNQLIKNRNKTNASLLPTIYPKRGDTISVEIRKKKILVTEKPSISYFKINEGDGIEKLVPLLNQRIQDSSLWIRRSLVLEKLSLEKLERYDELSKSALSKKEDQMTSKGFISTNKVQYQSHDC